MQLTLSHPITIDGIGVHSGKPSRVVLSMAQPDTGIIFRRVDIDSSIKRNLIKADFRSVSNTTLCTVLENEDGIKVSTVEHLLSALYAMEIDNAMIEINQEEVPILDGSSSLWCAAIKAAGYVKCKAPKKYIKVLKPVAFYEGNKMIELLPIDNHSDSASFIIDYLLDYPNTIIGRQEYRFVYDGPDSYEKDIAFARTFGFVKEVAWMQSQNLAIGASLDNAVGIDDEKGVLNDGGLRSPDEFVRHKILDVIGDLSIAGYRLLCRVRTERGGHALNNKVLHLLFADPSNYIVIANH